jgi:hypothetical protein
MRTLDELLDSDEPALPILQGWIDEPAGNGGTLIVPAETVAADTLVRLQVTTRSVLGTLAYETGGISIADGFVRLLGSGAKRSIIQTATIAGCPLNGTYPDIIIVGDDVFGGLFALNGGRFGAEGQGQVFHLAADDTVWVPLGVGHSDFVRWCLTGDLSALYAPFNYLDAFAMRPLPAFEETLSFYPFLWTKEAQDRQPSVRVVSADESVKLRLELCGFAVS